MLNSIIVMGRATKDPELRRVASGNEDETLICNFDVAIDNIRKEKDGSKGTTFLPVTCFGNIADNVAKFVRKGSKVAVVGHIEQRNFMKKDGSKGSNYVIIADSVEFLDPKPTQEEEVPVDEASIPTDPVCEPEPKFDPYTGKPLKPAEKK